MRYTRVLMAGVVVAAAVTAPAAAAHPHAPTQVRAVPGDGDREGTNFKLVRLEQLP
jgi:3-phytase